MERDLKRFTDYLVALGTDEVPHTGNAFLAHLIAVCRDLESWNCERDVCRAGLFHSIYGTERFQKFCLPLERRSEVRDLIGERAEYLAYLNCAMHRSMMDEATFDENSTRYVDRFTNEQTDLSATDFKDLCTIQVCDWLEQVPRSQDWDYRREGYKQMAKRLGGIAWESYEKVFARETHGANQ